MNEFKKIIKNLRIEFNLTQQELADALDVSQSVISNWEIGLNAPTPPYLVKLAKLFDVTTDFLLGLED